MTPLLLLPGLLCDDALWQYQATALAEIADVIIPDFGAAETIAGMAEHVLESAPERFAVAGLSMGGYVAFEIIRRAANRVTRAAFLDTQARPETPESLARRRALIDLARRGQFKGVTPRLLPQLLHPDHVATPLAATVLGMAERVGSAGFFRQQNAIMGRIDSRPGLAEIKVPTLVVCGDHDTLTPPVLSEEIADNIQGSVLAIIARAGHLSPLEQPEAVNRAMLGWLSD